MSTGSRLEPFHDRGEAVNETVIERYGYPLALAVLHEARDLPKAGDHRHGRGGPRALQGQVQAAFACRQDQDHRCRRQCDRASSVRKVFHLRNKKMKEELTKLLGNRDVEIVIEKYE